MKQAPGTNQYRRIVKRLIGPYTQAEAALAVGTNVHNVQDWVAGRTRPSKPALRKLIDHFKLWSEHFGLPDKPTVDEAIRLLLDTPDEQTEPEGS